ncbi:OLC1v1021284C1 [Oldenlandia corymbosa var. corymbosa]|uniref:OLC1v1021284C1 n=1 Tax=Oldenlandia corymbosa var. corymbosa TaxID=529605 RepID=A0AAV1BYX8_OLDCO|nr:OLC1v1021284C1 [Oldenlandia corymbosa var. corymbosa]
MEESSSELQSRCYEEWMKLQEQELSELLEAIHGDHSNEENSKTRLLNLIQNCLQHFRDYSKRRNELAASDVSPYFAPNWCSTLEGSMLWIGGCRPSMFIRLLYAKIGKEIESGLEQQAKLGGVSATQMCLINSLQAEIIKEEDKLSAKLTSLQEDLADQPIALIADDENSHREENNRIADEALDNHAESTVKLLEEADELRIRTLKELILGILSPLQAVEFLAASKKLRLCIREWGRRRDNRHGRNMTDNS